eukprot:3934416-Rhodomonas_salina.2
MQGVKRGGGAAERGGGASTGGGEAAARAQGAAAADEAGRAAQTQRGLTTVLHSPARFAGTRERVLIRAGSRLVSGGVGCGGCCRVLPQSGLRGTLLHCC